MLITKEMRGGIYVAQLGKTFGPDTAGALPIWFFIGPGLRPTVVPYGEDASMVIFDYMGVLNARLLKMSEWPPTQVDPVTYTPFISLQRSEDAIAFSVFGSAASGHKCPDAMLPANELQMASALLYDTTTLTFSTTISRLPYNPDPITLRGWRFYSKPMGAPEDQWVMGLDWQTEIADIPVAGSPKLQMDYCVTWGHLFDPERPNDPWARLESPKGVTLTLDSDKLSKTLRLPPNECIPFSPAEGTRTSASTFMDSKQRFFNIISGSNTPLPLGSTGSSSFGLWPTMGGEHGRGVFHAVPYVTSGVRVTLASGSKTSCFGRIEDRWTPTP